MDKRERVKMVKAMEFIARQLNDEDILYEWLTLGVADGDIQYGDLAPTSTSIEELADYFDEDDSFADLMDTFLHCMSRAAKSGGLYCDKVCSAPWLRETGVEGAKSDV